MVDRYINSAAGYLPLLRMDRKSGTAALRWAGLGGSGKGSRTVAGWDEDVLTMAVEAARGLESPPPDKLILASTSAYFVDRSLAGIAIDALGFLPSIKSSKCGGLYTRIHPCFPKYAGWSCG